MGRVILALDVPGAAEARSLLTRLGEERPYIKVGMELFYATGADFVRELVDQGFPIFLDLKLHDIPHTVERAMRQLHQLGVSMTNVHAAGGRAMMEAARAGFGDGTLIAVTQLTSTSEEVMQKELLITQPMETVVASYAHLAHESGLNGVVCSPLESPIVHAAEGDHFLTVTPGIRFQDAAADDQRRVTTPAQARALGSSYIVVGRAVTAAADPKALYRRVVEDFEGGRD